MGGLERDLLARLQIAQADRHVVEGEVALGMRVEDVEDEDLVASVAEVAEGARDLGGAVYGLEQVRDDGDERAAREPLGDLVQGARHGGGAVLALGLWRRGGDLVERGEQAAEMRPRARGGRSVWTDEPKAASPVASRCFTMSVWSAAASVAPYSSLSRQRPRRSASTGSCPARRRGAGWSPPRTA